jgi:anti-anti-sigma regulatory factor
MAANFRIRSRQTRDGLHLELVGDFDASSAMQLLYRLRQHCAEALPVVVDTSALNRIEPLGLNLLHYNIGPLKHQGDRLSFLGRRSELLQRACRAGGEAGAGSPPCA